MKLPTRTCPSRFLPGLSILLAFALVTSLASRATGQYMSITTDNPADSTLLNPFGATLLTITLDTDHDRDGSLQACNSHTNQQGCGAILTGQPLDLFSFTITLTASGGTVGWGVFTAADPAFEPLGPDLADGLETEFTRNLPLGSILPPGRVVLGTISVTVLSGAPSIQFARGPRPIDPFGFGTGFGTSCDGYNFANTYMLGDPANLCPSGDWYDADGVPRLPPPGPNQAPTLNPILDMNVALGGTADQAISGFDPEGTPILFYQVTGPQYVSVFTTSLTDGYVHAAPRPFDWGSFSTVRVSDGYLMNDRSFAIVTFQGSSAPMLRPIADITMKQGETRTQEIAATYAGGNQLVTFVKVIGPSFLEVLTTGTTGEGDHAIALGALVLRPGPSNVGVHTAVIEARFGTNRSRWGLTITVLPEDHPPSVVVTGNFVIPEGTTGSLVYDATDPDGDSVCLRPINLPGFASAPGFVCGEGSANMAIQFSPGYSDAGSHPFSVSMTSTNWFASVIGGIEVTNVNRCPTAAPGGPYSGVQGLPVEFDGSGSSDPDGDPLQYSWDFDVADGIGADATGPKPSHVFDTSGSRTVTLTVTDNAAEPCVRSATTTASIFARCAASIQNGFDTIRLGPGRPTWFALVEPASDCYTNGDVRPETFVLKYGGHEAHADATKTLLNSDKNHNGVDEIQATFSKQSLRSLFQGLGGGHNDVTLTIEAMLTSGGRLQGTTQIDVLNNAPSDATVAPNPFNPNATLTFTQAQPGNQRIALYDIHGRQVRLLDERYREAGVFDVAIDGLDARGQRLPSGIYFIRGISPGHVFSQAVTILK